MNQKELKIFLDKKVAYYNQPLFIKNDPISIPHRFTKQQDIEIAGFFAAIFAWGNRTSIINSASKLMQLLGNAPYQFIMSSSFNSEIDTVCSSHFVHRTFNEMDLYHLLSFLRYHYWFMDEQSLETAFTKKYNLDFNNPKLAGVKNITVENALTHFHNYIFGYDESAMVERHCRKHISTPEKKSACKRLNMFLRWMVRNDNHGVDFGLWKNLTPAQLICPLDVHVANVARQLGLLTVTKNDWNAAIELTTALKQFDINDPVKYDFALFSMGVIEQKIK